MLGRLGRYRLQGKGGHIMSEQEYRECLEALRQSSERIQTPEEARKSLIEEGFITEDGELSPNYQ